MHLTHKVYVLLAVTALPPVGVLGWVSVRTGSREIEARVVDYERRAAVQAADSVERSVREFAEDLARICDYVPFERFPPGELGPALRIPYRQLGWATAVALLDEGGRPLAPPARRAPGDREPADREPVGIPDLEMFGRRVRLSEALSSGVAVGPTYLSASGAPRLALARSFSVAGGRRKWVLAVEASLADIQARLAGVAPGQRGVAYLVDSQGVLIAHARADWLRERRSMLGQEVIRHGLARRTVGAGRYANLANADVLGAFAPIAAISGGVVVEEPTDEAFGDVRRLARIALFWTLVALALAAFGALILARAFTAPIRALRDAASAIGRGDFGHKVEVRSHDELGELAGAFNRMSAEVQSKQEEVTAWNRELAARVDERTRELREARDQVVRSEKLAATAELAAGVAHELNNPLTSILGLGQVMLETCTNGVRDNLEEIVHQADRMRGIIRNLARFARPSAPGAQQSVELNRIVDEAVAISREKLDKRRIEVTTDCPPGMLSIDGTPSDLLLAVLHLINNAVQAMPKGGALLLQTRVVDYAAVKLTVRDTGVGIAPDRLTRIFEPFYTDRSAGPERGGGGLGLSVAHRIVEEHQGRISVTSEVSAGTTFTVFFPGRRKELHVR